MKILTCQNVSFGYENKAVVRDVSFDIESGNFLSILGENGTGKSTLIKGILGLLSPSNGKIEYHISRNEIGYLPQQVQIRKGFPATVREVIMSGLLSKQRFGWGKQKEKREVYIMFDKIKELIVDSLGIEEDQITMEASFKEDLKVDSLDLFEMVMSLEDEFGVEIPTEELEKMVTVGDVVNYIEEHK